jgi:putative transcriptional regulator
MRRQAPITLFLAAPRCLAPGARRICSADFPLVQPGMQDENFPRPWCWSSTGPNRPAGVILNRPTNADVGHPQRAEFAGRDDLLFFGGPVQPDALLFAFRSPAPPEKGLHVADDIYISGFSETLDELLRHPEDARNQRFFTGYAGWGVGQLETEIAQGGWYVLQLDTHAIFDMNPLELYPELLERATSPRFEARHESRVAALH